LSIKVGGRAVRPTFQLDHGRPRPIIDPVLAALPAHMSGWQVALWFISGNGWLGDRVPVDCLEDESTLLAAAGHEGETILG
jgi:hypothetical protein